MSDIKFECPACGQPMTGNAALLAEVIECPECHLSFTPRYSPNVKSANSIIPENLQPEIKTAVEKAISQATRRAAKIHDHAWSFSFLAAILLVIGFCGLLARILNGIDSDYGDQSGLLWGATCLGAGLWLYLIAQVIHIRANTEK